jgi:hypothetical protein
VVKPDNVKEKKVQGDDQCIIESSGEGDGDV